MSCYVVLTSSLVNTITVEDDSGTAVDETVFAELSTAEGICFVIKDSHGYGK